MNTSEKAPLDRGLSIRRLHVVLAAAVLLISALLVVASFQVQSAYTEMRESVNVYIELERDAASLQTGSDYLTEQVRCFVETGKRVYLDNYFEEAEVTRRRDKALESIGELLGDTAAYLSLEKAMEESVTLMDREYYAMRLTIAARGYDYTEYPEAIRNVELEEDHALMSPTLQDTVARRMVFDDVYHVRKDSISANTADCLAALADIIAQKEAETSARLDGMLLLQRFLVFAAIIFTMFSMGLTNVLVVRPLLKAVSFIRADEPLPIKGSSEFQFLAQTYNQMVETNQTQKQQLLYDARHDRLTGVYNRHGYDRLLKTADWSSTCLLLFDVDKFKQINDTYGHEVGDQVLRRVADTIRAAFRADDYTCRIGGDEFAVIMVRTGRDHADLVRDKVSRMNAALGVPTDGLPPIHLSCGFAYGVDADDSEQVFRAADAALYLVKKSGGCGSRAAS